MNVGKWMEKDLEDYLFENPDVYFEEGYLKWIGRQVSLSAGRLDLLGLTIDGNILIFELKRGPITESALFQVKKYQEALEWGMFDAGCTEAKCIGTYPSRDDVLVKAFYLGVEVSYINLRGQCILQSYDRDGLRQFVLDDREKFSYLRKVVEIMRMDYE